MDLKFKDHNIHIQNYVSRIYTSPQYIVYRKSTRFHERPYNGIGAIYKWLYLIRNKFIIDDYHATS